MAQVQGLDRMAGALADNVELPLEGILVHVARAARHEYLPDDRPRPPSWAPDRPSLSVGTSRQPSNLPFRGNRPLDLLLASHAGRRLLGQEHHADAVLAERRERDRKPAAYTAQEGIGQLDEDACAVALQRIRTWSHRGASGFSGS